MPPSVSTVFFSPSHNGLFASITGTDVFGVKGPKAAGTADVAEVFESSFRRLEFAKKLGIFASGAFPKVEPGVGSVNIEGPEVVVTLPKGEDLANVLSGVGGKILT